jgi:hypothetical protein
MALTRSDVCILLPAWIASATGHAAADQASGDQTLKSAICVLKDLLVP